MKKIYSFLASPKLAFILVICIAILALLGSFIPQGDKATVLAKLASIFDYNAERVYNIMLQFGIDDIYRSKLFMLLLGLFAINLIFCTIKLLPFAIRGYVTSKNYDPALLDEELVVNRSKEEILTFFAKSNFKGITNNNVISAERHESGRYGVIILHFGILLVLLGAFIGHLYGFKGFMNVLEGDSDNVSVLKDGTLIPLGFELFLNEFDVKYYPRTDRAESYRSDVSIKDKDGTVLKSAIVDVNHPLTYNRITFYQTNFGFFPRNKAARFKLTVLGADNKTAENVSVDFNEVFKINDKITAKIVDFAPTLALKDNAFFSASDAMINPAVLVEMYEKNEPLMRGWVMSNNRSSGVFDDLGFALEFHKYHGVQYSGFSVRKDPGRSVVYFGFGLIGVGLLFIYLLNYTTIFFMIETVDGKSVIRYRLLQQRKHALADPAKDFFKVFKS